MSRTKVRPLSIVIAMSARVRTFGFVFPFKTPRNENEVSKPPALGEVNRPGQQKR